MDSLFFPHCNLGSKNIYKNQEDWKCVWHLKQLVFRNGHFIKSDLLSQISYRVK